MPSDDAIISGTVQIFGSAGSAYVVEYSRNDVENWVEIARSDTPVKDGELCRWDTNSLDGVYQIRLTVGDMSVKRTNITVVSADKLNLGTAVMTAEPDFIVAGSSGNILNIIYTAYTPIDNGAISITVPEDWSTPQQQHGSAGYTTIESAGAVGNPTFDGQTIDVPVAKLHTGQTITVIYGSGGGASGAVAGAKGTATFTIRVQVSNISTLAEIREQPAVIVYPSDIIAETLELTATPSTLVADSVSISTISIIVKSVDGRLVTDETVSLSADFGAIPDKATNNGDGTYLATYTSNTKAGTATIVAKTENDKTAQTEITLTSGPPETITIEANPDSLAIGNNATVTITVTDAFGNLVTGETITLTATEGNIPEMATEAGDGVYTATYTPVDAGAGKVTIEATTSSNKLATTVITLSEYVPVVSPSLSSITTENPVVTVGEEATVTITVKDNGDGTYSAAYTSGNNAGKIKITSLVAGVKDSHELTLTSLDIEAEIESVELKLLRDGSLSPNTAAKAGDVLEVKLIGEAGGTADFEILGLLEPPKSSMSEKPAGIYVGQYAVKDGDNITNAIVAVRLTDKEKNTKADTSLRVNLDTIPPPAPLNLNVTGGNINLNNFTAVEVTGRSSPNRIVNITLTDSKDKQAANVGATDSSGRFAVIVDASQLVDGYVVVTAVEIPDDAGNEGLTAQIAEPGVFKNTQDVPKPEFELNVEEKCLTGAQGKEAMLTVWVIGKNGFDGTVKLRLIDLPSGITCEPQELSLSSDDSVQKAILPLKMVNSFVLGQDTISIISADFAHQTCVKVGNQPSAVAVSPGGETLYVANQGDNTIAVIHLLAENKTEVIKTGRAPSTILPIDERTIYVTNFDDDTVWVIDTVRKQKDRQIPVGHHPTAMGLSPSGRHAYVVNNAPNGGLSVIDTKCPALHFGISSGQDNYPELCSSSLTK